MNFENTYRQARTHAKNLMQQGQISAYIKALQDLKDLQYLRAMGIRMQEVR